MDTSSDNNTILKGWEIERGTLRSPFVALVVETLQELGATFRLDGELFTPPTETEEEGENEYHD